MMPMTIIPRTTAAPTAAPITTALSFSLVRVRLSPGLPPPAAELEDTITVEVV